MSTLPAAIRAYRADQPNVRITLRATDPAELLPLLRRHDVDVGVFLAVRDLSRASDIDARPIATIELEAIVATGHPLAHRASIRVDELAGATFIVYDRRIADIYDAVVSYCRQQGFTPARLEEVDRVETILGLVAAGEGVAIVPQVYRSLRFGGLAYVPLTPAPDAFTLVVARLQGAPAELTSPFVDTCERLAVALPG